MTHSRYRALSNDYDETLTQEELAEGWHWCADLDGMLVGPGMPAMEVCQCERMHPELYREEKSGPLS